MVRPPRVWGLTILPLPGGLVAVGVHPIHEPPERAISSGSLVAAQKVASQNVWCPFGFPLNQTRKDGILKSRPARICSMLYGQTPLRISWDGGTPKNTGC